MRKRYLSYLPLTILLLSGFVSFGQASLFTVPASGHYCQGSAGVQIKMAHSQNGITYHLRRLPAPGDLTTATGNGDTITFAGFYSSGTYYTVITTTQVTIVMDPQPALFILSATGKGAYCNYPGALGSEIRIQPTQNGVNYELFRGATSIAIMPGTGSPISFGYFTTPGSYHVVASYPLTGCSRTSSSINIVVNTPPTANFFSDHDTPPLHCATDVVNFTSTSTGTGLSCSWNFHDPNSGANNTSTGTPTSHIFEAYGNVNQTFGVLLKVTDSHGCIDTLTRPVTVIQKPDATLNETLWLPNTNFPNTFAACNASLQNPVGTFQFVNGSTTQATNTWYNISWGASGMPPFSQPTFSTPLNITYNNFGYDALTYIVNGQNGCNNTRVYPVYVGNFAGGGLGNPGSTAGVADFCIDFPIQPESYDNPPGTMFTFNWGDGDSVMILRENLPANGLLEHCYSTCSTIKQGTPPKYGFKATCNSENPCGSIETSVWPIPVSCKAQGEFGTASGSGGELWGGNGADTLVGCSDVTFTDSTQSGFYIIPPTFNTFTTDTYYSWNFGDPASGVNNTSTLPNPTHHFTTSGLWYTVTLIVFTGQNSNFNSGRDTVAKQIYIQSPPIADFNVNAPDTCIPMQVQFTDMSNGGGWGIPEYRWRITPVSGWSIITPNHVGDSTYNSPLFLFSAAGRYTIKFLIANSCGIDEKDTTILACQPPEVAFTDGNDIYLCGPQKHNFGPAYNMNCDSTLVHYKWIISPGTFAYTDGTTDTSSYPHINFNAYTTYLVKAVIRNSCGSDTATQNIHITQLITNNSIAPFTPPSGEVCAGQSPIVINGALPLGGNGSYIYQWQENVNCDLTPAGIWSNITVGGTLQNYTLMSPLAATRCYRRLAFDASDCSDTSNIAQIIVHPAILNNQIASDQQICTGSAPGLLTGTTAFGGSATPTYQWESSLDGTNFSVIIGATGQNYQPSTLAQSTYFERVAISPPCDSNYSTPVLVTVCAPLGNNIISSSDTICQGTAPAQLTGTPPTGACGVYSYQWQSSTAATYPVFSNIPGAIAANYQPPVLLSKTYYRRIITSTVSNCIQSTSNEIVIDLMPRPVPNAGLDQTISNGATANLAGIVLGGTLPYTSYQWSPPALIQPPSNTLSVTTISLSGSTTFTLTVTDNNGCIGNDNVTVTVTGSPLAATASANPTTICPNSAVVVCATSSGGSGTYSYSWSSIPAGVYPTNSCITVNPLVTTTYTCLVWDGFGSVSASATVTVNAAPVLTSATSESICNGEQLNYSPTSTIVNSTYTWTSSSGGTCSGNTSSALPGTNIPDFLFNSGNTDCIVTYRITPRGPAPTFCVGQPDTLEVTVKPVASITNTVNSQTTVSGFPTAPVTFTTNVASADIHWKYTGTNCTGFVAFSENEGYSSTLPSQIITLIPGSPSTCTLNYLVQPYIVIAPGDTCKGNPFTYSFHVNSEPAKYDMICPLPICSGQAATISLSNSDVGINYTLYRGVTAVLPAKAGTGSQLDWTGISLAGTYTVKATNPSNGQSTTMNGMCQLTVNALPQIFLLTAQNGDHCSPITILLSGSQSGIDYHLIKDGDILNPVQVKPGTGLPGFLAFDPVMDSGTYTVIATNPLTLCQRQMQGSVHVDPLINQFEIFPGGILCESDVLCIDGSEPGINYQLWLNNQPFGTIVQGDPTGGPICFGSITNAGTYRIHAKNPTTNCEIFFDSTAVIHPLPNIYVISPDFGCAGSNILLNNCQPGIKYYLYFTPSKGPVVKEAFIAGPLTCSGGNIDFGPWNDPGVYRIKAVDTITNCSTWMMGTSTIYPEPEAYNMVPKGPSCPPVDIRLDHYQLNTTYYLYRNGDTLVSTDDGTDGVIDFGTQTIPGIYKVRAQKTFPGGFECWNQMNDSTVIYRSPVKYSLLPVGPICPPVTLFLNGSDPGVTYILWHNTFGIRQVITSMSGGNLYFLPENQPGNYWVMAKTADSCTTAMYDTVIVHPNPMVFHVLPQGSGLCEPTQIGLENSEINTIYELLHSDGTSLAPPEVHTSVIAGPFWFTTPQPAGSYLVRATNLYGCDTLMNGTAIVNSLPVVDAGIAADTICFPPSPSVVLTGTATNYSSVHWSSPTNPSGSNFSAPNNLVTTYTFTATDFLNKKAVLTLSAFGTGICVGAKASDSIFIHLLAPVVNAGPDQIKCINEFVQLNGSISGGATSGVWSTGGSGTFSDSTSLTSTYTPGINDQLAGTVTLTLTTTNSSTCPNISDAMNVTIYGPLTSGVVSSNQTICNTEIPVTLISTTPGGGSGTFNYQWQLSVDGGATWTNVASGGNTLTYSPPALSATTLFRLQQTDTYCTPDQVVYTNSVTITVHSVLTPGIASANQTICNGETPASITAAAPTGGSGTFTYQWQKSTDGGIIWTNVALAGNSLTYSPPALIVTTLFRLLQTDTYCNPDQLVTTNNVTITVYTVLVPGVASANQTICNGETPAAISAIAPTGGSGTFTYQWQQSTDGGTTWSNVASAGNSLIYSPTALTVTTLFRLKQTDTYCNPDQLVTTNSVNITVDAVLVPGVASANQTICNGETPAAIAATAPTGGSGTFTYQWQQSTDG
ncbi:MAG: hypothetical protein HXX13_04490, partial [Bacteroidetes bacterium]|nr:hypothetical protein [Bacteroidota bacterium]